MEQISSYGHLTDCQEVPITFPSSSRLMYSYTKSSVFTIPILSIPLVL